MAKEQPHHIDITDVPALLRLAEEVQQTNRPVVLHRGSEELAVLMPSPKRRTAARLPVLADPDNIWTGYDPKRVQQALHDSAGALKGINRDELVADLAAQRRQHSHGCRDNIRAYTLDATHTRECGRFGSNGQI